MLGPMHGATRCGAKARRGTSLRQAQPNIAGGRGQNEIGASTPCNASNQRCHHFSRLSD